MKRFMVFAFITLLIISEALTQVGSSQDFPGLQFRNIGPFRGGRSVAVAGVAGDPNTYYMGTVGGGVWKTTDAGIKWLNVSDGFFKTSSVGAIAVAVSDPNVLYVGMGEHSVRGMMTSHGDGVYKSEDAGKTWRHIGLADTRQIARIVIHPSNPDVVYVAAQGAGFGPSQSRGIYKSIDGGVNWKRVLYVDENSGASEISMDPSNPRILYASTWDHRRTPSFVRSGGEGSGLYKSTDSGETWQKLTTGLPSELGKTAISVSPANSSIVYANIESSGNKGGVYRSNDGGMSWTQTTSDRITVARAWYYIEIYADPIDENTVYVLNAPMLKSIDGGKTFKAINNPHSDQHDLWINPSNNRNMILANDGGACISFNGGETWSTQQNQPTIQFYRVIADNQFPYNLYGGQQDNTSVITPSRTMSAGISWRDWSIGPGCECAFVAFDPDNPVRLYGGCYQGIINALDIRSGARWDVMAYPVVGLGGIPSEMKYRFNWNAPIVASIQDPSIIYHAANVVLKTSDGGLSWSEISGDLTRNDKSQQTKGGVPFTSEGAGGEIYNTIAYLEVSPHSADVLWVGSDCGLVHLTLDGGQNWSNVTPPNLGEMLINSIAVSPHDPATAYIAANRFRFDDHRPMLFKTTNYGRTWTKIVDGIKNDHFAKVIREDKVRKDLLFAGTEQGLYISYNGGQDWKEFQLNLPVTPITDITFADNDLIVATAGRSFWILDDLSAIQQGVELHTNRAAIYQPKPAYRVRGGGRPAPGTDLGENPMSGVVIDYYLPEAMDTSELIMEFWSRGELMKRFSSIKDKNFKSYTGGPAADPVIPTRKGLNRFAWDMRKNTLPGVNNVFMLGAYQGVTVPPGEYTVRLSGPNFSVETTAILLPDPRIEASANDYTEQFVFMNTLERMFSDVHESVNKVENTKGQLKFFQKHPALTDELKDESEKILKKIDKWESQLIQRDSKTFQDVINFENKLNAEIASLLSRANGLAPVITLGMRSRLQDLTQAYNIAMAEKTEIIERDCANFNKMFNALTPNVITVD